MSLDYSHEYGEWTPYSEAKAEYDARREEQRKKIQLFWRVKPLLDEVQQANLAKWLYIDNETDHPGFDLPPAA